MNKPATFTAIDAGFRARFTTAEFLHMAETGAFDDMKVELVDGELERMNPPMNLHADYQAMVIGLLWPIAQRYGLSLRGEVGIDLGDNSVLGCDAALLRTDVAEQRLLRPDEVLLAVEVAETTIDRDLGMKRVKYAIAAIANYWVVDRKRAVIHVLARPIDGDYEQIDTIHFGDPLAVPGTDTTIVIA